VVLAPELAEPYIAAVDELPIGVYWQLSRVHALLVCVHLWTQTSVISVETFRQTKRFLSIFNGILSFVYI
jgi:hypothetical protein